jgi:hypothetical protein
VIGLDTVTKILPSICDGCKASDDSALRLDTEAVGKSIARVIMRHRTMGIWQESKDVIGGLRGLACSPERSAGKRKRHPQEGQHSADAIAAGPGTECSRETG